MAISKGVLFGLITGIVFAFLIGFLIYIFSKVNFKMLSLYTIGILIILIIIFSFLGWLTEILLKRYL